MTANVHCFDGCIFFIKTAGVGSPCWHVMVEFECDNAERAHLTEADDAEAAAQDGAGALLASLVYSGYWRDCLDNPPRCSQA